MINYTFIEEIFVKRVFHYNKVINKKKLHLADRKKLNLSGATKFVSDIFSHLA